METEIVYIQALVFQGNDNNVSWEATHARYLFLQKIDPRRKNPDEQPERNPIRMPVIDTDNGQMDVISRLLKDRILLLGQGVDDEVANVLVAQLLYLANEDPEKDITLYINSPGGSVSAGMAIYDTMQYVPCDVSTVCFGMAASMGAFLLGAGAKGKRKALPNSRIMIHQPLGGAQGQAADIEIQAKEILFIREVLNTYIADYCGQSKDKIEADCDRDFFMTPEEAVEYGIIDEGKHLVRVFVFCALSMFNSQNLDPTRESDQNQNKSHHKTADARTLRLAFVCSSFSLNVSTLPS